MAQHTASSPTLAQLPPVHGVTDGVDTEASKLLSLAECIKYLDTKEPDQQVQSMSTNNIPKLNQVGLDSLALAASG